MGDLSRNFSMKEFACKCKDPDCPRKHGKPDPRLIIGLEELRARAQATICHNSIVIIVSGLRCEAHDQAANDNNKAAGLTHREPWTPGLHCQGIAADVQVEYVDGVTLQRCRVSADNVYSLAIACPTWYDGQGGIGVGPGLYSVHLDVREGPGARWRY